jgi:hypothetical protein
VVVVVALLIFHVKNLDDEKLKVTDSYVCNQRSLSHRAHIVKATPTTREKEQIMQRLQPLCHQQQKHFGRTAKVISEG